MGRYLKYLEIVNKIDDAIEKKVAGKVDIDKDLPKVKAMLEVQKLALELSMCIDRIDDNVKSAFKLYAKGDPSARGVVEEVLENMEQSRARGGESASGRDFHYRRENPESDRRYSAGPWPSQRRSDAYRPMSHEEEERDLFDHLNEMDRRGRSAQTGRYVHRAHLDEPQAFWPLTYPGYPFGMLDAQGHMGFTGNGVSDNAPYSTAAMPKPQPAGQQSPQNTAPAATAKPAAPAK